MDILLFLFLGYVALEIACTLAQAIAVGVREALKPAPPAKRKVVHLRRPAV